MKCPTEFTRSVFADGELPEAEAREVIQHLQICDACDQFVAALRGESLMLVQCLQDIDSAEYGEVPEFATSAPRSIGVVGFGLGVIGAALAFRLSTGILFGLQVPKELAWVDPKGWFNVALDAASYAFENASLMVNGAVQTSVAVVVGGAVLLAMARVVSRNAAASSIFAVLVAIGLFSSPSYAIDMRKGAAASIPAGETVDDSLMLSPDEKVKNIEVAGTVKGDLLVVGDVVTISGNVEGNVIVLARRVEISGTIGGSLVSGGQTVIVSGRVLRNGVAAGSIVTFAKSADIGGNAVAAGGEMVIEGKTQRDLIVAGGMLDLRGDVVRNVLFSGGQAAVAKTAHIGGNLGARVQREENVRVAEGAVIGGSRNVQVIRAAPGPNRYLTVSYYVWQVVRILAAFVTGLILFRLVPSLAPSRLVSGKDWLKAGGLGFAALVTLPIAAVVVGITVIGLPIALISLAIYLAACYFAKIMVAEFIGRSLMKTSGAVPLLAGVVAVVVGVNLPWIGGLISFLLLLLGLGAIVVTIYRTRFQRQLAAI